MNNQDIRYKEIMEELITLAKELEDKCSKNNVYWFANDTKLTAKDLLEESEIDGCF